METIDQKLIHNKPEKLEKQECGEFIETIKNSILETFPFVSGDQKKTFSENLSSIVENNDDLNEADFIKNIKIVIASLENTHTNLRENNNEVYILEAPIFYKAHKFWIKNNGRILEVTSINRTPILELVQTITKEIGGGTHDYKINSALRDLNVSEISSTSILNVKDEDNNKNELNLSFITREEYLKSAESKKNVDSKMLDETNGYLKIDSWSSYIHNDENNVVDLIEEELKIISSSQSLIIDVRGNGGGDSLLAEKLAGHFIKQPVCYATIQTRQDRSDTLSESKLFLTPQSEFLDKKVVILTDPKCLSSNELFIMMLKDTGVATTIGQTTGGGSGNPKSFSCSLREKSYALHVSTWKIIRNNGTELENNGIEPDIVTEIKASEVIKDRDIDLETALKYLKNS